MANNEFLLLRHARTEISSKVPVSKWNLSKEGFKEAAQLALVKEFNDFDIIISSCEVKANLTIHSLAMSMAKPIVQFCEFDELNRDSGGFVKTTDDYNLNVKRCLSELNKSVNKWEKASHALSRFSKKIDELDELYENKKILISSHGIVINLYFAKVLNQLDIVYNRWKKTTFCDFGIIKNGLVVKDIAKL
ncbi:MAG: histidine phosphatase family protein [Candidatus Heimdallarchaeota archaeon]|nr:histidine phosphatase family protein [Candidatus Heimdallarchaeota archaeon]